jgi:hypothetical protein
MWANRPELVNFNTRVLAVGGPGENFIKLERVLPFNISMAFSPEVWRFECEYFPNTFQG